MDYLPIFLKLQHKPCLVVGGGEVALRKVESLLQAHAEVTVVAPQLCAALVALKQQKKLQYVPQPFRPIHLNNVFLVIAATNDEEVNDWVYTEAEKRHILVNAVDNKALCRFIFPAIVDRSPVVIAMSSGGDAPVLVRLLRAKLESLLPANYGRLAEFIGRFRHRVKQTLQKIAERRQLWERVLQGPIAEKVLQGDEQAAEQALVTLLQNPDSQQGEVYLVGAGPGDPDLLTFRALRLMQQCDVVLYDRLVSDDILALVRKDATRVFVGKAAKRHVVSQSEINQLLVQYAQQGQKVLRLKGGDPFIFGRGGEEIDTLVDAQIPFQIVPGITAATGCAAFAGIPLTHRDYASSVTFVSGHTKEDKLDLNWQALVHPNQTLVVYMGVLALPKVCAGLIAHGMAQDTPIAIIERGTTTKQRVVEGTLKTLPRLAERADIKPPSLMIIGEVVRLRQQLHWYHPEG